MLKADRLFLRWEDEAEGVSAFADSYLRALPIKEVA